MEYLDGVFVYEWQDMYENNCNSFYLGDGINAFIDPGLTTHAIILLGGMRVDGVNPDTVKFVLNTHSHPDHYEASAYFQGMGAKVALHEDEVKFLNGEGGEMYSLFGIASPDVTVDVSLKEGELSFGNNKLQIIHTPGHSPGSIAIYWKEKKALFCGDTVFDQNVGRTDFSGGSPAKLKDSIKKLASLDVEHLFPGHMGMISGKENVKRNFDIIVKSIFPYL